MKRLLLSKNIKKYIRSITFFVTYENTISKPIRFEIKYIVFIIFCLCIISYHTPPFPQINSSIELSTPKSILKNGLKLHTNISVF